MHIEGAMDQSHLTSLKYQHGLFKKVWNESVERRDKLKEQLKEELKNVQFYSEIVSEINDDIVEVQNEIKKNYRTVSETHPNIPDISQ